MSDETDQKWREFIAFFLNEWSSPLTAVLGNSALLEVFLEALAQQSTERIPVESGSFKSEMTPQMALELMRNIRKSARALSRLKEDLRDSANRLMDDNTSEA